MSCYVVENEHIRLLVDAALHLAGPGQRNYYYHNGTHHEIVPDGEFTTIEDREATVLGRLLLAENLASVNHRYQSDDDPAVYEHKDFHTVYRNPIVVLKAISCYEYQSSEHPGWESSEAHSFCMWLRDVAINKLPGYDDAPGWSVSDVREVAWTRTTATRQAA